MEFLKCSRYQNDPFVGIRSKKQLLPKYLSESSQPYGTDYHVTIIPAGKISSPGSLGVKTTFSFIYETKTFSGSNILRHAQLF